MFRSRSSSAPVSCALCLASFLASLLAVTSRASARDSDPLATLTGKAGGLTADEVAARAVPTSFSARAQEAELAAAEADLSRAVRDFWPRLSGSASYFRLSPVDSGSLGSIVVAPGAAPGPLEPGAPLVSAPLAFESPEDATTLSTTLSVPLSDYLSRLWRSRDSAAATVESQRASLRATRRKTDYDARALYYDWVRAELEAAAAEQNVTLSAQHLERLRALQAADSASPADVARVEATLAAAEKVLIQAKNVAKLQQARLSITMHDASARSFVIGEDFRAPPAERPDLDDIAELTRRAEQNRPELAARTQQATAYEEQARALVWRALPRLDASASATLANPNERYFPPRDEFRSSWQVGIQLSFSPTDALTADAQVRAARAQAAAATAERSQLLDSIRADVVDGVLAHRTAREAAQCSRRRLAAAEISYRARWERFQVGDATLVELTEAQTELFDAQLEVVQSEVAIRQARARIAYVAGP